VGLASVDGIVKTDDEDEEDDVDTERIPGFAIESVTSWPFRLNFVTVSKILSAIARTGMA